MSGKKSTFKWRWALGDLFDTARGSKDLYHVYIGTERQSHSAVVARTSIYGERVRYFIETELWRERFLSV